MAKRSSSPNFVTKAQAARLVGVSPQSVDKRVDRGLMTTIEYAGTAMVPKAEVRRWIREREAARAALAARLAAANGGA